MRVVTRNVTRGFRPLDRSTQSPRGAGGRQPPGARGAARRPRPGLLRLSLGVAALSVAWFLVRWAHPVGPPLLSWLPLPVCPALGIVSTARVSRIPELTPAARRVWRCFAYAAFAVVLATLSLTRDSLVGTPVPRQRCGPLTIALFLVAVLVALWGAVRLPVRARTSHEWVTIGLDVGIVLVATGLLLAYATALTPQRNTLIWLSVVLTASLGVLVAIKVSLTGFTGIDAGAMRVLAISLLVGGVVGSLMPLMASRPDLNNTMLTLPVTYAGIYYAAELQRRTAGRPTHPRRRLPFSLLPYAAIACTDMLLLAAVRGTTTTTTMVVVGSIGLTSLVVVRQTIAFFDNRRYQEQLTYRASHDELTGLANRSLFCERVDRAVADAAGTVAVAIVDLDDFKGINDRLGHTVGDALLVEVGAVLRACVRPGDTVARLGGDEFAILLPALGPRDAGTVAMRILTALTAPVRAGGHHLLIQASIGLVDSGTGAGVCAAEDLLRRADIAMYTAKDLGKNRYVHYDEAMDASAVEHAQLAAELSGALDRGELYLLYQPIVDLVTGDLVGVESLVRWRHAAEGHVSPVKFIPVAERTGLIVPIGAWILRTACRQAADWRRRLGDRAPAYVTVNVSARQLLDPLFARTVAEVLAETGLDPSRLTVEITETAVFGGGRAVETVAAIHALGVHIALDDFGTGHSSLGLLRTCPVDVLKVDKSFVDEVTGSTGQAAITAAIIEIAQALGLRAIAEGVETPAQVHRLLQLGYQTAQGYHFARPLPPREVEAYLPARTHPPIAA